MGLKKYSCLLFDLDHTLWDFESNSEEILQELFHKHGLQSRGVTSFNYFYETFVRVNTKLWDLHDRNLIGTEEIRTQRFHKVFGEAGLDDHPLSLQFSSEFLRELPTRKNLLPHAHETLRYLHERYPMAVVTNGFDELQAAKMISGGIHHYFKKIITSQTAGNKKPSKEIFEFALAELGHKAHEAVMIGDNLQTDMGGARGAGIDTVYFNPSGGPHAESVTYEIKSLKELQTLL